MCLGNHRGPILAELLATIGIVLTVLQWSAFGEEPVRVVGATASVINLVREADPHGETGGDYYEVYKAMLTDNPVILLVGLTVVPAEERIVLERRGTYWNDTIVVSVVKDGQPTEGFNLELLPHLAMAVSRDGAKRGDWTGARREPVTLEIGEALAGFFRIVGPDGPRLEEGDYEATIGFAAKSEEVFGFPVAESQSVHFRVKSEPIDKNRFIEDTVERHYLWACRLYKFDRSASKKEFEKAWNGVQDYLRLGGGDEPELWNITPRYQASRIAGWLDRREEEIAHLSSLLSKNAEADKDCRMRFYHFHTERGHLPPNVRDDLTRGLNDLYERVYAKTMSGEPARVRPPMGKNFPEDKQQSLP